MPVPLDSRSGRRPCRPSRACPSGGADFSSKLPVVRGGRQHDARCDPYGVLAPWRTSRLSEDSPASVGHHSPRGRPEPGSSCRPRRPRTPPVAGPRLQAPVARLRGARPAFSFRAHASANPLPIQGHGPRPALTTRIQCIPLQPRNRRRRLSSRTTSSPLETDREASECNTRIERRRRTHLQPLSPATQSETGA